MASPTLKSIHTSIFFITADPALRLLQIRRYVERIYEWWAVGNGLICEFGEYQQRHQQTAAAAVAPGELMTPPREIHFVIVINVGIHLIPAPIGKNIHWRLCSRLSSVFFLYIFLMGCVLSVWQD